MKRIDLRSVVVGAGVTALSFSLLGTVSALWDNPFFIRMTPISSFEIGFLAALSLLLGIYVIVRRPACSVKLAGSGGILGFLGVACPVCNKVLLLIFGGDLLLTYYEPVRIYVAGIGVAVAALAVGRELWLQKRQVDFRPSVT
jgi:hypothetical protein